MTTCPWLAPISLVGRARLDKIVLCAVFFAIILYSAPYNDWPGWRGEGGQGISHEENIPVRWNRNSHNISWKVAIPGVGRSSPVVIPGKVLLTTADPARLPLVSVVLGLTSLAFLVIFLYKTRTGEGYGVPVFLGLASVASLLLVRDVEQVLRGWRLPVGSQGPYRYLLGVTLCLVLAFVLRLRGYRISQITRDARPAVTLMFLVLCFVGSVFPSIYWAEAGAAHIWIRSGFIAGIGLLSAGLWVVKSKILSLIPIAAVGLMFALAPSLQYGLRVPLWKTSLASIPLVLGAVVMCSDRVFLKPCFRNGFCLSVLAMGFFINVNVNFNASYAAVRHNVVCLSTDTGALLWQQSVHTGPRVGFGGGRASNAIPTVSTAGDRLIVQFNGVVASLDINGRVIWKREHSIVLDNIVYGVGSSPIVAGGRVYFVVEKELVDARSTFVECLDVNNGRCYWHTEVPVARCAYGTPILYPAESPQILLSATWDHLVALNVQTGKIAWTSRLPVQEISTSVVVSDDMAFVAGGSVKSAVVAVHLDKESAGQKAPSEAWNVRRRGTKLLVPNCLWWIALHRQPQWDSLVL